VVLHGEHTRTLTFLFFGAKVVVKILSDPVLRARWEKELEEVFVCERDTLII